MWKTDVRVRGSVTFLAWRKGAIREEKGVTRTDAVDINGCLLHCCNSISDNICENDVYSLIEHVSPERRLQHLHTTSRRASRNTRRISGYKHMGKSEAVNCKISLVATTSAGKLCRNMSVEIRMCERSGSVFRSSTCAEFDKRVVFTVEDDIRSFVCL